MNSVHRVRDASHAGSWYSASRSTLTSQLDGFLSQVPPEIPGVGRPPIPGATAIIAPHAGFSYSGPAAAWAYKCLDLSRAKRIFILHPSHHQHLTTAALSTCLGGYETPLSKDPLPSDPVTLRQLESLRTTSSQQRVVKFTTMSPEIEEAEHSCEMQLPYVHRLCQLLFPNEPESSYPPITPIMIGSTNPATEIALGKILAPFIADPSNAFVISSDFCHWGSRFGYTYYLPDAPSPALSPFKLPNGVLPENATTTQSVNEEIHKVPTLGQGTNLRSSSHISGPKIHESVAHADRACMCAIASGEHKEFIRVLQATGNTVCGRHPIGVFMAGVEEVRRTRKEQGYTDEQNAEFGKFRFVRYERSSDVVSVRDSSVSYVSAFAVL